MKKCLIDTDILIDYLRGHSAAVKFIEKSIADMECYISTISIAELYSGVREGKERQVLTQFLTLFEAVEVSEIEAEKGGLFRRDYVKSHSVGLADALIGATAQLLHAKLITLNKSITQ